jgi:hypothetical protein
MELILSVTAQAERGKKPVGQGDHLDVEVGVGPGPSASTPSWWCWR